MFFTEQQKEIDRLKKETRVFQDLSEILRELIDERKAETARYERLMKEAQEEIDLLRPKFTSVQIIKGRQEVKCIFENMSPEDLLKPLGISCPCPRCSTYSLK